MTQDAATSLVTDLRNSEFPYARSWIDRLIQRISRIPVPSWLFYVAVISAIALLNNAVFWVDGSLAAGSINSQRVADSGYLVCRLLLAKICNSGRSGWPSSC